MRRKCPDDLCLELRSGQPLYLSGDQDDVTTALVVIGRKDYGHVPKDGVVIDVGAHMGAFTLYAALEGASRVYSYEPDPKLFSVLQRNIAANRLEQRVKAWQAAVVGSAVPTVTFYPEANAAGHVMQRRGERNGITVPAVTLFGIVFGNSLERVDLLKLDCEGSEYAIIQGTAPEVWERIARVRMEYHEGRVDQLARHFEALGYQMTRTQTHTSNVGVLWFDRPVVRGKRSTVLMPGSGGTDSAGSGV